jgi:putative membrane protein
MQILADIAVLLVALLQACFLVLEMFLWDKPTGLKIFGLTTEQAHETKVLAANQGLYNGFISAGLVWGLLQGSAGNDIKVFFLLCVVAAGVFGAVTANTRILYVQALPGLVGLILVLASTSDIFC